MKSKNWNKLVIFGTVGILFLLVAVTVVIDPFLHYHKQLSFLEYPMKDERYQNDGIARWYEYDAMITGTSMTQNFKVTELNEQMGVNAIKTSYSGASFHEISQSIERALEYNSDLRLVLCSLDGTRILYSADGDEYTGYPAYLYDNNLFNDVKYVLNKDVIPKTLAVLNYTRAGEKTPTMDEYGTWWQYMTYGKDAVLSTLTELPEIEEDVVFTEADKEMVWENVTQNYLELAQRYPDVKFYFFLPPYSIVYWEALCNTKQLNLQTEAEIMAVEILLQAENVHVYGFSDRIDIISNLDNYTDSLHYGPGINSEILRAISEGEGELTSENLREYYDNVKALYLNYDYSTIRAE